RVCVPPASLPAEATLDLWHLDNCIPSFPPANWANTFFFAKIARSQGSTVPICFLLSTHGYFMIWLWRRQHPWCPYLSSSSSPRQVSFSRSRRRPFFL